MSRCPACGHEDNAGAKFCPECGAALAASRSVAREERKVVTVLFADLVGFTSRSEQLDPEDVRAFLSPYYARLRRELEGFGGTVEKFIGDAVMALFGAPVAHEDDPERAVRAALAIRDWVLGEEAGLQLRIAVNTGEVLVALGAQLSQGEGMVSGDVVNTTARLQTAAPVNGILVGETTYRATSHVITYRAAEAVTAKGKTEPVPAWEALEARSRFGVDLAPASSAPLVGRQKEVSVLTEALERVRSDHAPQLVTLAGVPGMGKSRLVGELGRAVDENEELISWRQGRSLPYGDGVTFWALSEMVKAQAGILETDTPGQAEEKLGASVAALIPERADAQWVEGHLRPLAGLSSDGEAGGDRRDEAFAAWRRFFEALAEESPLVLVFEDLHWADDSLLNFIEHLVGWAGGVPLLVVCTARPELFERRPGWGGGTRNTTTLWLTPLSDGETAELISSLSDRPVMPAETQQALLARAGGNPLYAEQYVRMLEERGDAGELLLPETVQGIIAARLDALPVDEKRLLQSAAVVGKVFWLGALTEVGGLDRRASELHLHALERKDFVQRARRSSVAGESEYAFLHVLVRDVAYGQIPRGQRADQHRLAAEWIGSLGRSEDHAEMLAHHYRNVIELRRAAGQPVAPALAEQALTSLRDAGDRAFSLNAYPSAATFYQSALELAAAGSPERAHLLLKLGRTRVIGGELDPDLLATACRELLSRGDLETAAEAEAELGELIKTRGDTDRASEHYVRARELLRASHPSRVQAQVISRISSFLLTCGNVAEAIQLGREALAMAERLGLDDVRARALDTIGRCRLEIRDLGGIEDLEQSLAIAVAAQVPMAIFRANVSLGVELWQAGQLKRAAAFATASGEAAAHFGLIGALRVVRGNSAQDQYAVGRWQEALEVADDFLADVEGGSPHYAAPWCYATRAQIRLGRDDVSGALADVSRALELAPKEGDETFDVTLARCAHVFWETGDADRAAGLADDVLIGLRAGRRIGSASDHLHLLAWTLTPLGRGQELIDALPNAGSPWGRAAALFAAGDLGAAADVCAAMGAPTEEARDRLWLAEALIEQNRRAEADVELLRALAFYRSVGATRYIREAESLLAASA
jgi:class 3 adenylate cyclase/tetratricopeptide (TPR) repeat protein